MLLVAGAMFGFGFALAPLYEVFCRIAGINGKTAGRAETGALRLDLKRLVTVELLAYAPGGLAAWGFRPAQARVRLHPGRTHVTRYLARNPSPVPRAVRAIPSVAPGLAAAHLHKSECFCFARQVFAPGEERALHLAFALDPELPAEIGTLSLAYTLFEADSAQTG
jgi:cytochrome c oxidase assembly protein subunit 11